MRIVFMGTADFGLPTFSALAEEHEIVAAVTVPDKPKGRGRSVMSSPVKVAAVERGIPVMTPEKLSNPAFVEELKALDADLFFVVAFRILPRSVFELPRLGTVNLHGSLLPDYRGAAPINWAVINGDTMTGLTTFFIDDKIDTGDILLSVETAIGADETAGELYDRLSVMGADLSLRTVAGIGDGSLKAVPQPDREARPAPKLFKPDGLIDWSSDSLTIHNKVRGMNPVPGAFTECSKGAVKVHRTEVIENESSGTPGMIAGVSPKEGITVSCGKGTLRITEIQPPGKKKMDCASFVRGCQVELGINICSM